VTPDADSPSGPDPVDSDPAGAQLAASGRVALIGTRGRVTGRAVVTAVGFVSQPDGSLLVAAGHAAAWALNLLADPVCTVTIGDHSGRYVAEPLARPDLAVAVRELILKYGTPSERLGAGPAFRLRPPEDARPGSLP